ncbi:MULTISPECIES: hypothetical protein [unclassified Streptomyces]|uniref:hypothetical protein n=1 Tax=unclassified Streptomyces TaxID=2593676 RepID=UPI00224DFE63|nr:MULTISPECIES: hypothetical protein [unclassified Streptomyces]MCX4989594.1 hypothetical protein [Streptomyces sp. NBC_00568]MCX5005166.1 hypothetical protein [Streptomyces sp. NBC_00638]
MRRVTPGLTQFCVGPAGAALLLVADAPAGHTEIFWSMFTSTKGFLVLGPKARAATVSVVRPKLPWPVTFPCDGTHWGRTMPAL